MSEEIIVTMKRYLLLLISGLTIASCNSNSQAGSEKNNSTTEIVDDKSMPRPSLPKAIGAPRILFVGNSHTEYYVSLPVMFDELCQASNQPMNVDKLVTMGVSIQEIYDDHKVEAEEDFAKTDADSNYYDIVVLQEKTPTAFQELDQYKANVKMMVDKIRKNSPGAAIYIYQGMSPVPFDDGDYEEGYKEMRKNAMAVVNDNVNAGLFRVGDAIKDAYDGKDGYQYNVAGKDRLRFGQNTLHLLNDGGYLEAVLLYATIFRKMPTVPAALTLCTGTNDDDEMKKQPIGQAISNPKALDKIALGNR